MMVKSTTVKIARTEVTIADIGMILRSGAEIKKEELNVYYDQDLCKWITEDVGVVKFREHGAETTITLSMREMVEIVKELVKDGRSPDA
jgi:hypothetical protein